MQGEVVKRGYNADWREILHRCVASTAEVEVAVKLARKNLEDRGVESATIDAVTNLAARLSTRAEALLSVFDAELSAPSASESDDSDSEGD